MARGTTHNPRPRIIPAHGNYTQRALEVVRVDRYARIIQEDLELQTAVPDVLERPGEGRGRGEPVLLEPLVHPREERLHVRLAVREPMHSLDLAGELLLPDLLLYGVDRGDAPQPLAHCPGVGRFGLEQLSPGMAPALCVDETELLGVSSPC